MLRPFLYHFFKTLKAWRYLLPKPIQKILPRKLITLMLFILFLWFIFEKFDLPSLYNTTKLPTENSHVQFYSNQSGQNLKYVYLKAINEAKSSILLMIYALRDFSIIQALQEQSRRGIEVTVICDAEASPNIGKQLGPMIKVHYQQGAGLMHLKVLVIDLEQVWVGSANLTGDSLKRNGNLVVGINSPTLAKGIQQQSISMLDPSQRPPTRIAVQLPQQKIELWFLPTSEKTAFHRLMNLLYQAKTSLKVAMFTLTHPRLIEAIIDAHERGVDVEVVLDRDKALEAENTSYQKLLGAGVKIGLSHSNDLLHYKMAWIDERILISGSANWTISAFKRNHDCFLVIDPLDVAQQKSINDLWQTISAQASFESIHTLYSINHY